MKWYHWTEFTWLLSGSDISRGTGYPLQKLGIIYCYLCEKVFLPFYLLRDYISTKLFSSNCRPHCVLIFLPIWFLSRQLTLYFRSRRWLKTWHHIFLVTTAKSALILCFSLDKFLSLTVTASGWWDKIHKARLWKHSQKVRQLTQSSDQQPIFGTSWNHDDADVFSSDYKRILPRLRFGLADQKPSRCLSGSKIFNAFDFSLHGDCALSHIQNTKIKLLA